LHVDDVGCYLFTVARLLSLLMMLALVMTSGAAVPMAMCQHVDAGAHALALQSSESEVASVALAEESAAAAASKSALADAAAVQLAGFLLPADIELPAPPSLSALSRPAVHPAKLASRAISPLLEPPLA
jgi:hypothetical protein